MKTTITLASLLVLVAALAACSQAPHLATATEEQQEPIAALPLSDDSARAQTAMQDLGSALRSALQARMAADGALAAIDFCHQEAPGIAQQIADKHGLSVGRTSLRQRSASNIPSNWQREVLEEFQARADSGERVAQMRWVKRDGLPQGVALRMMRAIELQPQCQLCHGREIDTSVARAIEQRYPDDLATGYSAGDLRGAMWVEVPVASQESVSSVMDTP